MSEEVFHHRDRQFDLDVCGSLGNSDQEIAHTAGINRDVSETADAGSDSTIKHHFCFY